MTMQRARITVLRRLGTPLAVVLLALLGLPVLVAWAWWIPDPSAETRSIGTNALWLRHSWVGESHPDADYAKLAQVLRANQISDAYFHAGPIEGDGRILPFRYAHGLELLAALHRYAPDIHVQAYIGQLLTTAGGPLDLHEGAARARILSSARSLLDLGFDGIHYDIEPVAPSDGDFLDLLQRTHDLTRAHRAILSVSIQRLEPRNGSQEAVQGLLSRLGHPWPFTTQAFLRQVADRVDQVAVMVYDIPLPTASLTGSIYAWEAAHVLDLIGDQATVFIGVPTYEEGPHLTGEDLRTAIRGARRGIDQLHRKPSRPYGLALFAEWTTSGREWGLWQREWVQAVGPGRRDLAQPLID